METIELSAEVNAPIWRVFQNWKRFESFPKFTKVIREVRQEGDNRLYWREEHAGREYEALFEITLQPKENSLQWRSISGANNSGTAGFEPLPNGRTRVTLKMDYEPDNDWQKPAVMAKRLRAYLKGFTQFIEETVNAGIPSPRGPAGASSAALRIR